MDKMYRIDINNSKKTFLLESLKDNHAYQSRFVHKIINHIDLMFWTYVNKPNLNVGNFSFDNYHLSSYEYHIKMIDFHIRKSKLKYEILSTSNLNLKSDFDSENDDKNIVYIEDEVFLKTNYRNISDIKLLINRARNVASTGVIICLPNKKRRDNYSIFEMSFAFFEAFDGAGYIFAKVIK